MEKTNSSILVEISKIICYRNALKKNKSSIEDFRFGEELEDQRVNSHNQLIREKNSFNADASLKEMSSNLKNTVSESKNELELSGDTLIMEVERLEMQKEALEKKLEQTKQKNTERKLETKHDSHVLQIKNMEKKLEMLQKRISYEKRFQNLPLSRWKTPSSLSKASKSLYFNNLRSGEILARKMKSKLLLKEEDGVKKGLQDKVGEDLSEEKFSRAKIERNWEKREGHWKQFVSSEESYEEMKLLGVLIRKSKGTTVFFPPIPDPMAKKRPRDSKLRKNTRLTKLGDEDSREAGTKKRLIPNRKRVSQNRTFIYEKQLEFAKKYGLETKEIIENLNREVIRFQQEQDDVVAPSVTKQQLHLIGALSEECVSP